MSVRSFIADLFSRWDTSAAPSINPATGAPMLNGSVDVHGNPIGVAAHRDDDLPSASTDSGHDHHQHPSSPTSNDWSSSSWSGVSSSWPDHSSSSSSSFDGGYDPSRGW